MRELLPLALTLFFFALFFYLVPIGELLSTLATLNISSLFFAFLFYSLSQLLRSIRWKLLLKELTLAQAFVLNSANIMFNNLLPARTGELSWFYYAKRLGVNLGYSVWSFLLGRLYDLFSLIFLLVLTLSFVYSPLFLLAFLVLLLSLFLHRAYILLPGSGRAGQIKDFIRRETSLELCLKLFVFSSLSGLCKFVSLLLLLNLWHLPTYRVFLAFLGGELSSVLPLHSLMGFGTYEFAFSLPLQLLGESLKDWLRMAFVFHSFLLLSSLFWGIPSALLLSRKKL